MSSVLNFDDLKKLTGYEKKADVITCLERNEIKYGTGYRGRPFATEQSLNEAIGANGGELKPASNNDEEIIV